MLVFRLGSSALMSVVEVRWFDLVVVVVAVCVSVAQLAKLRARTAITLLAIIFMLFVLLHQRLATQAIARRHSSLVPEYFCGIGCVALLVLPVNIHDPPTLAVME